MIKASPWLTPTSRAYSACLSSGLPLRHRARWRKNPPDWNPLLPVISQSNSKGFVLGDALYLAPKPWLDATLGAELFTNRGSAERGEFRARPFENTSIKYTYFGVIDRGLRLTGPNDTTLVEKQGGHQQQVEVQSLLPEGWRFVSDFNELTSLTFRLAFADNFGDAITASEVRSATFLSNNFRGFQPELRPTWPTRLSSASRLHPPPPE